MTGFIVGVALGCCVATLLPAGAAHLVRLTAFRQLIGAHGIVPPRAAPVVALSVAVTEITLGSVALVSLAVGGPRWPVLGATLLLGIAFMSYLAGLLRRPHTGLSCGCTPLAGPVTVASLLPAVVLAAVSALALVAAAAASDEAALFGVAWGATLAVAVMLVSASAPAPTGEPRPA